MLLKIVFHREEREGKAGDGRQETGERRKEQGERRKETEDGRKEKGERSKEQNQKPFFTAFPGNLKPKT